MTSRRGVMKPALKRLFKRLPEPAQHVTRRVLTHLKIVTAPYARVRFAAGVHPLSYHRGFDRGLGRGLEIARFYLEHLFLQEFSSDIRGYCLEFREDCYTSRFGGDQVVRVDILNKEEGNPNATIVADLTMPNDIPSNSFDCIICTHVLHVIFEINQAISELYRILKPGGVLLAAVPHVSMCDPDWHECWRFTQEGFYLTLAKIFGGKNIIMRSYGNSLTAAGELRGLAAHEFTNAELNYHDQRFAVEVCARTIKKM